MKARIIRAMRPLFVLLVLFTVGCATVPVRPAPTRVQVTVTHLPGRDAWLVHYQLPRPTSVAVFYRQSGMRLGHWRVFGPTDAKLTQLHGQEVLVAAHPTRTFDLELSTYRAHPKKDYEIFTPFTDGSVVVYTGHFDLTPVDCLAATCTAQALQAAIDAGKPARFHLEPRPSEGMVLLGQPRSGPADWEGSEDGTMVYFGTDQPSRGDHMTLIVDRGFPDWLRTRVLKELPKAFRLYAQATGVALSFQPTVLLSYGEDPRPSHLDITGGTRKGIVQLDIRLGAGRTGVNDPITLEEVLGVVTHEAAHLWNSEMFEPTEGPASWMHEGGAQAFAFRALVALGDLSPQRYAEKVSDAASDCAAALRPGRSLQESITSNYQLAYDCGWVVAEATEAAVRRHWPKASLFAFWGDLFRSVSARHGYGPDDYFRVLAHDSSTIDATGVRTLVVTPPSDPADAWLADWLGALGVPTRLEPDSGSERYVRKTVHAELAQVLKEGCKGVGPLAASERVVEAKVSACAGRRGPLRLTAVEGHPLFGSLAGVDAARDRCATGSSVRFTLGDGSTLAVPCPRPLPPRSRYLRLAPANLPAPAPHRRSH